MSDTTFTMSFDFTSASQEAVLQQLQNQNFSLLAFKGAAGPSQVQTGLPTWFSVPFEDIFGSTTISYQPKYKVYVFNEEKIAADTVITMDALSDEIDLGNALNFTGVGSFTSAGSSQPGTITLNNQRGADTPPVTVGLAGKVQLPSGDFQFLPFCAFTVAPQGSVEMTPIESVAMFAAQQNIQSGSVQARATAPGCSFSFNSMEIGYQLMVTPDTFAITNVPGKAAVVPFPANQALAFLNG